jgi:hypothetical protein
MNMLRRRDFLVGSALTLAACSSRQNTAVQTPQGAPRKGGRPFVIDVHQHYNKNPQYVPTLVRVYREHNAMACVLTPMGGIDVIAKGAQEYPDVVIPYGRIDVDGSDALSQVEAFAKAGYRGMKMHSPRRNWDDPAERQLLSPMDVNYISPSVRWIVVGGSSGSGRV